MEYFPLIAKFTCSKLDTNQKYFCMFKALKPQEWTIFVFFQISFFIPNVHHSFWKSERILTLMIIKAKGYELMNYFFNNQFEHIWFKNAFDPENYRFWKCVFNKRVQAHYKESHMPPQTITFLLFFWRIFLRYFWYVFQKTLNFFKIFLILLC